MEYRVSISSKLARASQMSGAEWRLFLEAVALLWTASILLRRRSLTQMLALANQGAAFAEMRTHLEPKKISEIVASASGGLLPSGSCLPQSLVTYRLLRKAGYQATVYIGTKAADNLGSERAPFLAHAWVQLSDPSEPAIVDFYKGEHVPLVKLGGTP
jgi:hypothetical protein